MSITRRGIVRQKTFVVGNRLCYKFSFSQTVALRNLLTVATLVKG